MGYIRVFITANFKFESTKMFLRKFCWQGPQFKRKSQAILETAFWILESLFIFDSLWQFIAKCDRNLLQNATEVYYKMRQVIYYKMREFYYKMRRLLQIATVQTRYSTDRLEIHVTYEMLYSRVFYYVKQIVKLTNKCVWQLRW